MIRWYLPVTAIKGDYNLEAYTSFAQVYDLFMDNVPYEEWSRYIIGLLKEYGICDGTVLDLGCGTANLAGLFCVYAVGMIYYYIICNFVINTPIAAGPLFLYCFVLAVPGDIALSILGAVVAKRVRPVLAYEAVRVRS